MAAAGGRRGRVLFALARRVFHHSAAGFQLTALGPA
jgi:hypothetical protein